MFLLDWILRMSKSTVTNALEALVADGIEAMRLTREYVGEKVLPEIEGWSWYDWTKRAEAALADRCDVARVACERWDDTCHTHRSNRGRDRLGTFPEQPAGGEAVCGCDIHFHGVAITGVCKCGHASHPASECTPTQPARGECPRDSSGVCTVHVKARTPVPNAPPKRKPVDKVV